MIKIGILGCGKIAQVRHIPEYAANPDCELVGFFNPTKSRAEDMAAKYGGRVYDTAEELLADPEIDAVSVCAANYAHAELTIKALKAGKSLAFEDISRVKPNTGFSKSNRHISLFAYQKMRELILYKEQKYGVSVRFINPAYTSQTGKLKYMRRYGLSVHGSASFVIARRGLGFTDKIPKLPDIPEYIFSRPRMKQWKAIHEKAKAFRPSDLIRHTPAF